MRACVRAGMGLCDRRRRRAAVCALPRVHRAERRPQRCLRLAAHSCRRRRPIRIGRRQAGSHSVAAAECSALPERRAVQWPAHGGCEALRIGYTRQREAQRPLSYWQSTVRSSRAGALLCFALLAPINEGTTSLRTALSRVTERSWKRTLLGFALRSDGEAAAQARRDVRPVGRQRRVDQEAVRCRSRAQRTHGAYLLID